MNFRIKFHEVYSTTYATEKGMNIMNEISVWVYIGMYDGMIYISEGFFLRFL